MRVNMIKKVGRTYSKDWQNERGFSLIETMIAATVITVGLVAVAGVSIYVSRTNSTSNTQSVLATAAQDEADALRKFIWDQVTEAAQLTVGGDMNYSAADANHQIGRAHV